MAQRSQTLGCTMRHLIAIALVALTSCATTSGRSRAVDLVAQGFAEYYVSSTPTSIEVIHVVPNSSEALVLGRALQSASRKFVVKTDGRYRESKSDVLDIATQKRCIVLRLSLEMVDDESASVTVWRIDGSWSLFRYSLSFEGGAWKVTRSEFVAAS